MRKTSLKEIARLAGVSASTVSLILNGKAQQVRISKDLEKKVMEIARKEGYTPNQIAISLRTGKSNILGLVVESISGQFFASLAKVIEDEADRNGYRVVYCSTDNNPKKGNDLLRMLSNRQVDGYLVTPVQGMEEEVKRLVDEKKPLVLIDSVFPTLNVPSVMVDNYKGVKEGMECLVKKGYKRIAFVTIDLPLEQVKRREKAYLDSMKKNRIRMEKELLIKVPYTQQHEKLIVTIAKSLKKIKKPEAIFFATNYLGIAGLESLRKLKWNIPDDIAVISFDDESLFKLVPPGISSIQQPIDDIAKTAIQLLLQQLSKPSVLKNSKEILLSPTLISRGSC